MDVGMEMDIALDTANAEKYEELLSIQKGNVEQICSLNKQMAWCGRCTNTINGMASPPHTGWGHPEVWMN